MVCGRRLFGKRNNVSLPRSCENLRRVDLARLFVDRVYGGALGSPTDVEMAVLLGVEEATLEGAVPGTKPGTASPPAATNQLAAGGERAAGAGAERGAAAEGGGAGKGGGGAGGGTGGAKAARGTAGRGGAARDARGDGASSSDLKEEALIADIFKDSIRRSHKHRKSTRECIESIDGELVHLQQMNPTDASLQSSRRRTLYGALKDERGRPLLCHLGIDLLVRMTSYMPSQRPSASSLLSHPYFWDIKDFMPHVQHYRDFTPTPVYETVPFGFLAADPRQPAISWRSQLFGEHATALPDVFDRCMTDREQKLSKDFERDFAWARAGAMTCDDLSPLEAQPEALDERTHRGIATDGGSQFYPAQAPWNPRHDQAQALPTAAPNRETAADRGGLSADDDQLCSNSASPMLCDGPRKRRCSNYHATRGLIKAVDDEPVSVKRRKQDLGGAPDRRSRLQQQEEGVAFQANPEGNDDGLARRRREGAERRAVVAAQRDWPTGYLHSEPSSGEGPGATPASSELRTDRVMQDINQVLGMEETRRFADKFDALEKKDAELLSRKLDGKAPRRRNQQGKPRDLDQACAPPLTDGGTLPADMEEQPCHDASGTVEADGRTQAVSQPLIPRRQRGGDEGRKPGDGEGSASDAHARGPVGGQPRASDPRELEAAEPEKGWWGQKLLKAMQTLGTEQEQTLMRADTRRHTANAQGQTLGEKSKPTAAAAAAPQTALGAVVTKTTARSSRATPSNDGARGASGVSCEGAIPLAGRSSASGPGAAAAGGGSASSKAPHARGSASASPTPSAAGGPSSIGGIRHAKTPAAEGPAGTQEALRRLGSTRKTRPDLQPAPPSSYSAAPPESPRPCTSGAARQTRPRAGSTPKPRGWADPLIAAAASARATGSAPSLDRAGLPRGHCSPNEMREAGPCATRGAMGQPEGGEEASPPRASADTTLAHAAARLSVDGHSPRGHDIPDRFAARASRSVSSTASLAQAPAASVAAVRSSGSGAERTPHTDASDQASSRYSAASVASEADTRWSLFVPDQHGNVFETTPPPSAYPADFIAAERRRMLTQVVAERWYNSQEAQQGPIAAGAQAAMQEGGAPSTEHADDWIDTGRLGSPPITPICGVSRPAAAAGGRRPGSAAAHLAATAPAAVAVEGRVVTEDDVFLPVYVMDQEKEITPLIGAARRPPHPHPHPRASTGGGGARTNSNVSNARGEEEEDDLPVARPCDAGRAAGGRASGRGGVREEEHPAGRRGRGTAEPPWGTGSRRKGGV
eukprot:GHVT01091240.1.p1 GENE.GHVT01091240.1~~GHVT01091240.1.p1  ORF type:complete len:1269 (+),score=325.43 GHVT01091240.1:252-4058(+)